LLKPIKKAEDITPQHTSAKMKRMPHAKTVKKTAPSFKMSCVEKYSLSISK
jgi:hypothetical protein